MVLERAGAISIQFKYFLNTVFMLNGGAALGHPSKDVRQPSAAAPLWIPFNKKKMYLNGPRFPR